MGSTNPPLLRWIEPRIRALVDALNGTGLVRTFTSCEGHYGYRAPLGDFTDRERANVGFFLEEGVSEEELGRFFGKVLADYDLHAVKDTVFTVNKRFAAGLDRTGMPEVFFDFTIRPRDPDALDVAKRAATDEALAVITACVKCAGDAPMPRERAA